MNSLRHGPRPPTHTSSVLPLSSSGGMARSSIVSSARRAQMILSQYSRLTSFFAGILPSQSSVLATMSQQAICSIMSRLVKGDANQTRHQSPASHTVAHTLRNFCIHTLRSGLQRPTTHLSLLRTRTLSKSFLCSTPTPLSLQTAPSLTTCATSFRSGART